MTPAGIVATGFFLILMGVCAVLVAVERVAPDDRVAWWTSGLLAASGFSLVLGALFLGNWT